VVVSSKRDYGVWIQALGCQPAFQRRGIASQLLEALLRKITIQRAPLVTVDVPTSNTPARQFFEAVDFTIRGHYVTYQGCLTGMHDLSDRVEVVSPPALLPYYAPFHTTPACWERNVESLAGYGTLPQGYAYYAQGTIQGYLIHRDSTILDLALAPQADAAQASAALLGHMRAAGCTHATLAKVPEGEPVGPALARLGFTPTTEYLLMGQDLQ
jgi:hypothetical protein